MSPLLGLIAVILYRVDKDEPERQCPTCHKALKLYVQVCPRCGTDLYLPDPAAVRHPEPLGFRAFDEGDGAVADLAPAAVDRQRVAAVGDFLISVTASLRLWRL